MIGGSTHSFDHDRECVHSLDNTLVVQGHSGDTAADVQGDSGGAVVEMVASSSGLVAG